MDSKDFELYRFRFDQMDVVRAAHRDTRRFFITLNVTAFSTLLGLYAQFGQNSIAAIGAGSFGLMLMCLVWYVNSSYAGKSLALKGKSVLELEAALGLSYFKEELEGLHGSVRVPRFVFDRAAALLLFVVYAALLYAAVAKGGGWQALLAAMGF